MLIVFENARKPRSVGDDAVSHLRPKCILGGTAALRPDRAAALQR